MMTEKRARAEGLQYTGIYERTSTPVKERVAEIKKQGYKAYLVSIPDDPLSRGYHGGRGYSVYTEPKYQLDKTAAAIKLSLANIPQRIESAKARHQRELEADLTTLEFERIRSLNWLKEHGYATP